MVTVIRGRDLDVRVMVRVRRMIRVRVRSIC